MKISKEPWSKTSGGKAVDVFTLSNGGITLRLATYGGRWLSLTAPDRDGKLDDIALSAPTLEAYQHDKMYLGALIGRVGNRIGGSKFSLNGNEYKLTPNNAANHLHGGAVGFDSKIWTAEIVKRGGVDKLKLSLISPDGDEGYPGSLKADVYHCITNDGGIELEYVADSDADTVCNLTQHNYFNLDGHASGNILGHELTIYADYFTELDTGLIPTGKANKVAGTPYDFNAPKSVGRDIADPCMAFAGGYDVNYILCRTGDGLVKAAELYAPESGRKMEVWTTKPSIQLYTGNDFKGQPAKDGTTYSQYAGLALETQYAPDSINRKGFGFNDIVLKKGRVYNHTTVYKIGI